MHPAVGFQKYILLKILSLNCGIAHAHASPLATSSVPTITHITCHFTSIISEQSLHIAFCLTSQTLVMIYLIFNFLEFISTFLLNLICCTSEAAETANLFEMIPVFILPSHLSILNLRKKGVPTQFLLVQCFQVWLAQGLP